MTHCRGEETNRDESTLGSATRREEVNRDTDFVFYSLEIGPFDIPQMQACTTAMNEAAGPSGTHPTALRIPEVSPPCQKVDPAA